MKIFEICSRLLKEHGIDTSSNQIHKAKAEKARERVLKDQMDLKRATIKAARERRQERVTMKKNLLTGEMEEEDAAEEKK